MSYRVRFTTHTGATGYWDGTFATRTGATHSAQTRADVTGYTYTVEEVPEPGSTAEHHVEILRGRVKNLEALVATVARQADELAEVNKAMHHDLAFALQLGDALRHAMRTGEWRAGNDAGMASNAIAGWDRWKPSLGKAHSASEAPGEGGDSDRRRLEALERWLRGENFRLVQLSLHGTLLATDGMYEKDVAEAPTLAALADKLAVKEAKP